MPLAEQEPPRAVARHRSGLTRSLVQVALRPLSAITHHDLLSSFQSEVLPTSETPNACFLRKARPLPAFRRPLLAGSVDVQIDSEEEERPEQNREHGGADL